MRWLIKKLVQISHWLNHKYPDQMPADEARLAIEALQKQVDELRTGHNNLATKTMQEIASIKVLAGIQKMTIGDE